MDKTQLELDIWQQLLRASVDKHHEWRSPVLVTNSLVENDLGSDLNQWPEARTVILRSVNIALKELSFYTHSRSQIVAQINANSHVTLVFWSKRLNWQLRVKVNMRIDIDNELTKKTWLIVKQSPSVVDYLSETIPGKKLDDDLKITQKEAANSVPHFALLIAKVHSIDWLALNRSGHQRAQIDGNGVTFLTP